MSTLTTELRARLQRRIAIGTDQAVFSDAMLDDNYTAAGEDFDQTVLLCWQDLAADKAKLANYANGLQREDLSDVFDHVMAMIALWERRVVSSGGGLRMLGLRAVPTAHRAKPGDAPKDERFTVERRFDP